ncbi:unnamed protein product [Rotaria sp. Silwood1]|nr:unnamed protein product [Rotaria sp. Silwood1]CAF1597870.1 unnamed protein product [Rotaria sp. Silwood1]CAF3691404.1 unnamed protein product [Rotaria sp. Silwood1]CAF4605930.1 unnamed protein product [Rotaria sp. Silwood1]
MTKKSSSAASSPAASIDNSSSSGRFVCSMCAKVYRSGAGLRYHKRKRHRGMVEPTALHRVKCQELGCTYQMLAISDLRNHLANHHQKPEYKCTEEKKFTTLADFTEWKSSFETSTGSKYVKNCGAKGKSDNQTTEYYYCNRTGPYKTVGQGLRRNKAQGSLRGGIHCTSSMKVEIQNDEHITVQYYPAHYGHSNLPASDEPQHLSENSTAITGANIHHQHQHQQQQQQQQHHHQQQDNSQHGGDRSSSSSPGSSSTSPSGGSNSNSNHPPMNIERQSITTTNSYLKNPNINISNINNNTIQNQMSHCIIISPSFMVEENLSTHSNHHHTPVFVVQQHLPTSSNAIISPPTNLPIKKEKCVSDIMHEAFQLLSYWPLDHHHGLITSENEQQISHSRFNMDEHLMF